MRTFDNFAFGKKTCVNQSVLEHIEKHKLSYSINQIVELADRVTRENEGIEGIYVIYNYFEKDSAFGSSKKPITMVIRGFREIDGKKYGIIRTLWDNHAGKSKERTGLPIKVCYDCLSKYFSPEPLW